MDLSFWKTTVKRKSTGKIRRAAAGIETLEPRIVLDSTTVFNEIMYNPAGQVDSQQEWFELHNQLAIDMDLSGWSLDGVDYTFPRGTVIEGGGYLVVAADPTSLEQETGFSSAFGPFVGRLSNAGEELRLIDNSGREMDRLDYRDGGSWPVGPDGSGVSLAKQVPESGSELVANWTISSQLGGTPGRVNFPTADTASQETKLITLVSPWRYDDSGADLGESWRDANFNDTAWPAGDAVLFAGDESQANQLAPPAGLTFIPISGDADSQIDSQRTYTHALDFGVGDDGATVNGVAFTQVKSSTISGVADFNLTKSSGILANFGQQNNHNVIGGSIELFGDHLANSINAAGGTTTMTLSGLTPGEQYDLRLYTRQLSPGTRNVQLEFDTDGVAGAEETFTINQEDASADLPGFDNANQAYAISYEFEAGANSVTVTFTQFSFNKPWLLYGLTNEVVDGLAKVVSISTIFSTGLSDAGAPLAAGVPDPHWFLTDTEAPIMAMANHPAWLANDSQSGWAGIVAQGTTNVPSGEYSFSTKFDLSTFDITTAQLTMSIGVDDQLDDVLLNGVSTGIATAGFGGLNGPFTISSGFLSGVNQLDFVFTNGGAAPNPSGLRVQLGGTALQAINNTPLELGPQTYYFRQDFQFDGDTAARWDLDLSAVIDDGAVFYLNGTEVYRHNMPAGPIDFQTPAVIDVVGLEQSPTVMIPSDSLRIGRNVLAVEVHQSAAAKEDLLFGAELTVIQTPIPSDKLPQIVFSEIAPATENTFWLEIGNLSDAPVDLAGYVIGTSATDTADFVFPTMPLNPGDFVVLDQNQLGIDAASGDHLFLFRPGKTGLADARVVTNRLRGRSPQYDERWLFPSVATQGAANEFGFHDEIVINEILYHDRSDPELLVESNQEWIELYNRSDSVVDLTGWSLDDAIGFAFAAGTMLGPGEYLVVAKDAVELRTQHPELDNIFGPFSGSLSNRNELIRLVDARNNPADEVHYYDGGNWSDQADGNGSSLELIDPDADNSQAQAWAASEESDRSQWQTVTYRGRGAKISGTNTPSTFNEFIFGLLDAGEFLIDDISVIESPDGAATELIQDGSISSLDSWRAVGNHGDHGLTGVVVDPGDDQNLVMYVVATGATEHMSNHVETTFVGNRRISSSRVYEISYRIKWLAGSNQLNTRLYFNRLARTTILDTPDQSGTPGKPNSVLQSNIGPTYEDLLHGPVVPISGQEVTVGVEASDPDGIDTMDLWYSVGGGAWDSAPMNLAPDGRYVGQIPGQSAAAVVQFYVEGRDTLGAISTYPAAGRGSRALYKVQDGRAGVGPHHNFRIIMTAADSRFQLQEINARSNDRLGGTIIVDERTVFYDVGVRLKGSGFSRGGGATGYNIRFKPDQLFRDVHEVVAIDRNGGPFGVGASHREMVLKQIAIGAGDLPSMYDDMIHFVPPDGSFTGPAQLMMARYDDVYLDSLYENGRDGTRFKFDLIYYRNTTDGNPERVKRRPNAVLGVDIRNMGDDPEAYRWNYLIKSNRSADDFGPMVQLGQTFSLTGSRNGSQLDVQSREIIDVDQWLRVFAYESLGGINDTYNQGLPHNLQFYVRPEDGRVLALPWDQDFAFHHSTNLDPLGVGSNFRKIINIPNNLHYYWGHLQDIISTTYNLEYLTPWVEHLSEFSQQNLTSDILNYVSARRSSVLSRMPRQVAFNIVSADPLNVGGASTATINGRGWVNVREIRIAGVDRPLDVIWNNTTSWTARVPVDSSTGELMLEAYDFQGNLIGTRSITVNSTAVRPIIDQLRITELMFNPDGPDDTEFIELTNISDQPIDSLSGVHFNDGVTFAFSDVSLNAGERIVIVRDEIAFGSVYGEDVRIAGTFVDSALDNGGEQIVLVDSENAVIQDFAYDDAWYPETDGDGNSLVIINPTSDPATWNEMASWRPSFEIGGSPGEEDRLIGDLNSDLSVDVLDLVIMQQNFGATGVSYSMGDLDGDGIVGTVDFRRLVRNYGRKIVLPEPMPAASNSAPAISLARRESDTENSSVTELLELTRKDRAAENAVRFAKATDVWFGQMVEAERATDALGSRRSRRAHFHAVQERDLDEIATDILSSGRE